MIENTKFPLPKTIKRFQREFFESKDDFTYIGNGSFGGKALGLLFIHDKLVKSCENNTGFENIRVSIPKSTIITTELFDIFMKRNNLYDLFSNKNISDEDIVLEFQQAELPTELLGDLRALISKVHSPLAIRSSSLIEDSIDAPFAGIYATKMIPNNQSETTMRFRKLSDAIKFVYASTFFKSAKDYISSIDLNINNEKMAVIIQECVGNLYDDYFYPNISGVVRSYNFYAFGKSKPQDGMGSLALGLGKTIVDGSNSWNYSLTNPKAPPPYNSISDLLKLSQNKFWAVDMSKQTKYDPVKETEFMKLLELKEAEFHGNLQPIASTYDPASDRIAFGTHVNGPRLLNFTQILDFEEVKLNKLLLHIVDLCKDMFKEDVEIEFALNFDHKNYKNVRFAFLQVRPIAVSNENTTVESSELLQSDNLLSSDVVLGNGSDNNIKDIVFVKPEVFDKSKTRQIANELELINKDCLRENINYLLIGFGRWGSQDEWLGIPVDWGQISKAKVIIEATLPAIDVEISQGSHFFHNLTGFKIPYFSVKHNSKFSIDWDWLNSQKMIKETSFLKHVRLSRPLNVKVDGKKGIGVVKK
ncbi:MAG: PEP/pyruvate-binding domain-containing protein [Pseudomonadota bacterium]